MARFADGLNGVTNRVWTKLTGLPAHALKWRVPHNDRLLSRFTPAKMKAIGGNRRFFYMARWPDNYVETNGKG
jgi:hypothetical protein